jgi:hypothetical protein
MGIKNLNRFFKEECKGSIQVTNLSQFSGKKIAIDISIYLYKYSGDGTLIENIYLMLSIFRHYNITPVFVFDGKPPAEKKALLQKRKDEKVAAECEYSKLKEQLRDVQDDHEKHDILNHMDMLKRNFIHISKTKIQEVKSLIRSYGATYYDAPGEADELCAFLAVKNMVWGCLSEDMDMFVYGCPRVLRYLSLLNHTVVLYDLKKMLDNLGITQTELREICVLSGTDYNIDEKRSLYQTLKLFKKFIKSRDKHDLKFYDWLKENTKYIDDIDLLNKIKSMFDFSADTHLNVFETADIRNGPMCKEEIKTILTADGFIFPVK